MERVWRSLKYEEVLTKAHGKLIEARKGIDGWILFYNNERPHQAFGYRTPIAIFEAAEGCGCMHNSGALTTYRQEARSKSLILSE